MCMRDALDGTFKLWLCDIMWQGHSGNTLNTYTKPDRASALNITSHFSLSSLNDRSKGSAGRLFRSRLWVSSNG